MPRLISVNVGLPREIEWRGRVVYTAIWKNPVQGRCRARRLNLDGDGQGDLAGHGGEQRAVFVYQLEAYRYWQDHLKRDDFVHGQFGENFTVEGLPDDEVCIGDRYRIGGALFEVTQPRVTCYRIGIRMNEPRMPALLTSTNRPGFYLRVLEEGDVGAGDEIVKVGSVPDPMTVAEINALLYSANHPRAALERALRIEALSPGWRGSFEALLQSDITPVRGGGNAGLMPPTAEHPAASGFRTVQISAIDTEGDDVISLTMQDPERRALTAPLPGQFIVVRLPSRSGDSPVFRSYSLSGPPSVEHYRISVKLEAHGVAAAQLRTLRVGDALEVSAPRGVFTPQTDTSSIVLLSAGIGVTPVLAILYTLVAARTTRQVVWLYQARDLDHHPFADEVRRLLAALAHARQHVCYSRPRPSDRAGIDYDATGHLSRSTFEAIELTHDAEVFLCGPSRFMTDMKDALVAYGVGSARIHIEIFDGGEPIMPGVVNAPRVLPHAPRGDVPAGPLVSFARSGVAAHWNASTHRSLLEVAEACDVPVRWSCRAGVCHTCESGLVSGAVTYDPEPLDQAADGNLLICCSQPARDVVIDL